MAEDIELLSYGRRHFPPGHEAPDRTILDLIQMAEDIELLSYGRRHYPPGHRSDSPGFFLDNETGEILTIQEFRKSDNWD
jgi:hypothetical protein